MKIQEIKKMYEHKSIIPIKFTGQLINKKEVYLETGDLMCFAIFKDETGEIECVFFPLIYKKFIRILDISVVIEITGFVKSGSYENSIWAEKVSSKLN